MLECREISVEGRLRAFSAKIAPGSRVHLIGPNGAGKSTLLARLAGVFEGKGTLTGDVRFNGQRVADLGGLQLARLRAWLCQQLTPASMMPVFLCPDVPALFRSAHHQSTQRLMSWQ